jgi:hypothetical protein
MLNVNVVNIFQNFLMISVDNESIISTKKMYFCKHKKIKLNE